MGATATKERTDARPEQVQTKTLHAEQLAAAGITDTPSPDPAKNLISRQEHPSWPATAGDASSSYHVVAGRSDRHHTRAMTNFVLVHGGFVGGWYWSEVADRLRKV